MKVLVLDDEKWVVEHILERMKFEGYEPIYCSSCDQALKIISKNNDISTIIVDNMIPRSEIVTFIEKPLNSSKVVGLEFAKYIRNNKPHINVIGYSILSEPDIVEEYYKYGFHYINKTENPDVLFEILETIKIKGIMPEKKPKIFIVHGHDNEAKLELKNFIQNDLKLGEPIILSEQKSEGKTVIEKFEHYAADVNLVFILLTPDDLVSVKDGDRQYLQPRQNVLIELGYFYGKLKRTSGNVILLSKSKVTLPTDLSGIMYIDITNGVESAERKIRRELDNWIK